ncbi:MAG: hypothetical protein KW793_00785 [Candidatus Doudnabacteria bacterium]|nr:hypothetical protein [Candidatus Doudnabacteria bacterium]
MTDKTEVLSAREELERVGIRPPESPAVCQTIWAYIGQPDQASRNQRAKTFIEAQEKYLDRLVCKPLEPGRTGKILWIRPRMRSTFALIGLNLGGNGTSAFEAYIKWSTGKPTYHNLSLVDLMPKE